ncbi:MAG: glycosyl transferase [Verrucomicrobiales bacterium]|nr:glycosyl transferase [Verrucomicrobiota bacterium JB025]
MKQVICMKWGTAYGPEYVNVMFGMLRRNITGDFRLICFTDDSSGVRSEVECMPLPSLGCEIPPDVPGKWPKIALWGKQLGGLTGTALFVDLDSVIVDNIDCYFTHGDPHQVYTARNWVRHFGKHGQTSVFRFPIGENSYMLEDLQNNPAEISRKYRFEQNYVTDHVKGGVKFWPEPWTKHFGIHSQGIWPLRYLRPPVLPKGARIITFPGHPKPPDAIVGRWSHVRKHKPQLEHLKWVFAQRKTDRRWRRFISRYIMPTKWVEDHWRE